MSETYGVFTPKKFKSAQPRFGRAQIGVLVNTVDASDKLKEAIGELRRLQQMRRQRGLPVSESAFANAEKFLERHLSGDHYVVPDVLPLDDGGVLLEWRTGGFHYQFEFCAKGHVECSGFDNAGNEFEFKLASDPGLLSWSPGKYVLVRMPAL